MKKNILVGILAICFIVGGVFSAHALVLTFDDLSPLGTELGTIHHGYGGFDWTNMRYVNTAVRYAGYTTGYTAGCVSGDYVAFNNRAYTGFIDGSEFDFNGAFLTAAWNTGLNIRVIGSLDNVDLYSETVIVDTMEATWFDFNYAGIDSLEIISFGGIDANPNDGYGEHFALDNFTFNEPINAAPVPEPCTMLLLGTGLAGMGYLKRKRAKK